MEERSCEGDDRFAQVKGVLMASLQQRQLSRVKEEWAKKCGELELLLERTEKELRGKLSVSTKENCGLHAKVVTLEKSYGAERKKRIEFEKEVKCLKRTMDERIRDETSGAHEATAKCRESLEKCQQQTQSSLKLVQTVVYELQRQEAENRALKAEVRALKAAAGIITNKNDSKNDSKNSSKTTVSGSARLKSEIQRIQDDTEALERELADTENVNDDDDNHQQDQDPECYQPPLPLPTSPQQRKGRPWRSEETHEEDMNRRRPLKNDELASTHRLAAAMIRQASAAPGGMNSISPIFPFQPRRFPGSPRSPRAHLATKIDLTGDLP